MEVFFWDAINDSVPPSLELFAGTSWSVDVARLRNVDAGSSCVPVAPVANVASGDEVWWWWRWRRSGGGGVVRS